MNRKIRVAQYGCGKMSKFIMRYVYEKGAEIVCAFDIDKTLIGKDISTIIECENKGIIINDAKNAENILSKVKPDIVVITTRSLFSEIYDIMMICAKLGINAITTCEEAFYPQNSSPTLFKALDEMAKKTGCTLSGTGYQDVAWGNLIHVMAGTTHKITKISGESSYNVEDYGIALAEAHGAGLNLEQFEKEIASSDNISPEERKKQIEEGKFAPSYMWNTNGWLCDRLNLTVKSQVQKCIPMIAKEDIFSTTLNLTIKKGDCTGMAAVVTTETEEGITIESKCIGKVYNHTEFDVNEWTVEGEPKSTVVVNKPNTVELTCASIVNRIPDIINAESGYVTTDKMPTLKYRTKALNEYVKD